MLFGAAPQISPLLLGSRRQPLSEIRSVLWLRVRRAGSAASSLFTRARMAGAAPYKNLEPGGASWDRSQPFQGVGDWRRGVGEV